MALVVKRAGAAEYGNWIKMLVLADPGAGKTRTASTWPNALYANCEGGMMSVSDRQPATVDIHSRQEMRELVELLKQAPNVRTHTLGVDVDTVVVDTFDEYAKILQRERLESERKEAFAVQDWGWFATELANTVRAFRNLEMNVIFNVHIKTAEDSETGRTFFKPNIQGGFSDEIAAFFDLVLLLVARPTVATDAQGKQVRTITRYMQTYPDAQHGWVKDRSGALPMEFTINFDDDYKRLNELMPWSRGDVAEATVISEVATPETLEPEPQREPAEPVIPGQATLTVESPGQPTEAPEAAPAPSPAPAPAVAPEPTPEPEDGVKVKSAEEVFQEPDLSTPEPEPTPEATSTTETAPEPEETVPVDGTVAEDPIPTAVEEQSAVLEEWQTCQGCGGTVESKDQADLSYIRHKQHLCRACFAARKKTRA